MTPRRGRTRRRSRAAPGHGDRKRASPWRVPGCLRQRSRSHLLQLQALAYPDMHPVGLAGGELQYGTRAEPCGGAPRLQAADDVHDRTLAVEEHGVDGEAHEERVDRERRLEQKAFALRQACPAQEPPCARNRAARELAPLADEAAALAAHRDRPAI